MKLWPHQELGISETWAACESGHRSVCVTSPTGGGKTEIMLRLIDEAVRRNWKVVLYTNRKMLLEQTSRRLDDHGIDHGKRASGHKPALLADVQVASIQTERSRVYESGNWDLHDAGLVLWDEKHINATGTAERIHRDHAERGAFQASFTATPLGVSHLCDHLIVAGTNSELRECGAHLPAYVYGPTEFDTAQVKRVPVALGEDNSGDDFTAGEIQKMWTPQIYAHVKEWWKRLNPDQLPAIGFAPGVPESIWLAEQFHADGVPVAHIDGENVWVDGDLHESNPGIRNQVIGDWKDGRIKVVWNRFVMREGLDFPFLYHLILATPIGSLLSYVQTVGRVLRHWADYDKVIIQDHGGNWHRHGSPNADRPWGEWFECDKPRIITQERQERIREKADPEPIVCPRCFAIRLSGPRCHNCKHMQTHRVRQVLQADGTLKLMKGEIYKPKRRKTHTAKVEEDWVGCYFRAKNSKNGMTFKQAEALFRKEHGWAYPPAGLPMMPKNAMDWYRLVSDVPRRDLVQP